MVDPDHKRTGLSFTHRPIFRAVGAWSFYYIAQLTSKVQLVGLITSIQHGTPHYIACRGQFRQVSNATKGAIGKKRTIDRVHIDQGVVVRSDNRVVIRFKVTGPLGRVCDSGYHDIAFTVLDPVPDLTGNRCL